MKFSLPYGLLIRGHPGNLRQRGRNWHFAEEKTVAYCTRKTWLPGAGNRPS